MTQAIRDEIIEELLQGYRAEPSTGGIRSIGLDQYYRCRKFNVARHHTGEAIGNIVGKSFGKPSVVARRTWRIVCPVTSGVLSHWPVAFAACRRSLGLPYDASTISIE